MTFIRLSHDGIALSCWSRRFHCSAASLHQVMRSIVYVSIFVACWFAAIGAFRSSLLFRLLHVVPSQVRFVVDWLLCFLIVGIQASGISIPLSLLMLLGWSLIWIASLTLRVYQWGSRSINLLVFASVTGFMCWASIFTPEEGNTSPLKTAVWEITVWSVEEWFAQVRI